jgi:hypothetical protein
MKFWRVQVLPPKANRTRAPARGALSEILITSIDRQADIWSKFRAAILMTWKAIARPENITQAEQRTAPNSEFGYS